MRPRRVDVDRMRRHQRRDPDVLRPKHCPVCGDPYEAYTKHFGFYPTAPRDAAVHGDPPGFSALVGMIFEPCQHAPSRAELEELGWPLG